MSAVWLFIVTDWILVVPDSFLQLYPPVSCYGISLEFIL